MPQFKAKILPGSMFSDASANQPFGLQEVINLRMIKEGEWTTVTPYDTVYAQFTNLRSAIEITEDAASDATDRFMLVHWKSGSTETLTRIEYDDTIETDPGEPRYGLAKGYANGGVSSLNSRLTELGVTLSSTPCKFFYHNGIVRITCGTSEPLWYGYIKRELFGSTGETDDIDLDAFTLEKCELTKNEFVIRATSNGAILTDTALTDRYIFYMYYFLIYDNSQYSLLQELQDYDTLTQLIINEQSTLVNLNLFVLASTTWDNNRVTGFGVVAKDEAGAYHVVNIIYFDTDMEELSYTTKGTYSGADNTVFEIPNDDNSLHSIYDGYYIAGGIIDLISNAGVTLADVAIVSIEWDDPDEIGILSVKTDQDITSIIDQVADPTVFGVRFHRHWLYQVVDGQREYYTAIGAELSGGDDYYEFTGIPEGTTDISPNMTHHIVAGNRSYCITTEADENDMLRYSPELQYDTFPESNLMSTQVGDKDAIKAITLRDERLIIFKGKSTSQGQFSGSSYSQDIGFVNRGLFAEKGYICIDNILYWMDYDDIYAFDGQEILPLTQKGKVREYYKTYVSVNSFFLYDKINNELWCVLNGKILVFGLTFKNWYIRTIGADAQALTIVPVGGFITYDNILFVLAATGFYDFNATLSFDEKITASFKSRLEQLDDPEVMKLLNQVDLFIKASASWAVTIEDPIESRDFTEDITPSTSAIGFLRIYPNLFFRGVEFSMAVKTAATTVTAIIREIDLFVEKWR